ncbi:MAG TPA: hypothetical protein VGC41_04165, partial [Kofleriaceae bacterium]
DFTYPHRARGYAWMGPTHVAIAREDGLDIIDIATHQITRSIPLAVSELRSDHGDKLWLVTDAHELVELVGPGGEPRVIETDVTNLECDQDLTEAVITHANKTFELVRGTLRIPLPAEAGAVYQLGGDRVSKIAGNRAWRSHVAGTKLVDDGEIIGAKMYFAVLPVSDGYFVMSAQGAGILRTELTPLDNTFGSAFPTIGGAVQLIEDGSLRVFDGHGIYELGRKATGFSRADASADGRFVAALTMTSDLLIWDLRGVRPVQATLPRTYDLVSLSKRFLWLGHPSRGLVTMDLSTGELVPRTDQVITGPVYIDRDADGWVAYATVDRLAIFDLKAHLRILAPMVAYDSWNGHGMVMALADGSLSTWVPGESVLVPRGKLATPKPSRIFVAGNWVYAVYVDHVERFDMATQKDERAELPVANQVAVDDRGVAYLQVDDQVYRWEPDHPARPFSVPVLPESMLAGFDHRLLFWTATTISIWNDGALKTLQQPSRSYGWDGGNRLVTLNAKGVPQVTDLDLGIAFKLPTLGLAAAVRGDVCAIGNNDNIAIWSYALPIEPAQLHAWLQNVTNAKTVGTSEAYSWP